MLFIYACLEIYMYIHIMINVCYFVLCLMTIQILDFKSIKSLTLTLWWPIVALLSGEITTLKRTSFPIEINIIVFHWFEWEPVIIIWKTKNITVETFPNSDIKIAKKCKIGTPYLNTQIQDHSFSWLGTGTLISKRRRG